MTKADKKPAPFFSHPVRQILSMLIVVGLVGAGAWLAFPSVAPVFLANPWLNGVIFGVFVVGVLACFGQVFALMRSVGWIEGFAGGRPGVQVADPPPMLVPLANLLRTRGARSQLSSSSTRSILESVSMRIEEARDITRYLVNLLIFLGLLGTFYGLATTVPAVVETIRSLAPQEGEQSMAVFDRLMGGLEAQLGGMGTAFSSSLLGLAGSLVVGLLELFAGHGQNRFFRELEEWLSSITRIGLASSDGEGGDSAMGAVLEQMGEQMELAKSMISQADTSWAMVDERLGALADAFDRLAARMEVDGSSTSALDRIAAGQERIVDLHARVAEGQDRVAKGQEQIVEGQGHILTGQERVVDGHTQLAESQEVIASGLAKFLEAMSDKGAEPPGASEAESRMRLRSIDTQLLKIFEELAVGRQESLADLRADLAELTSAVRARPTSKKG